MSLTDTKIKNCKPKDKAYKVYDQKGLFIQITPAGNKIWRFKYPYAGKEKLLSIGQYPSIGLKDARAKANEARQLLAKGIDPAIEKKRVSNDKGHYLFESVAIRWADKNRDWSESYRFDTLQRLKNHVYPSIGNIHINKIQREDLIRCFNRIRSKDLHTSTITKIHQHIRAVYLYAIAEGSCDRCLADDIKPLLPTGDPVQHRKALETAQIPDFLRKLDNYGGQIETVIALKLLTITGVRARNVFAAVWDEFDLDKAVWFVPSERMKMRRLHITPLPRQTIKDLRLLHSMTGHGRYLFPNQQTPGGHMGENTLNEAISKFMGFDATAHGMRAVFSTHANECGYNPDAIEVQLAHTDINAVRAAYNRSKYWNERVEMVQQWADHLDSLKAGAEIIPFRRAG